MPKRIILILFLESTKEVIFDKDCVDQKFIDFSGQTFWMLTVIKRVDGINKDAQCDYTNVSVGIQLYGNAFAKTVVAQ